MQAARVLSQNKMRKSSIAIIGGGTMGEAFVRSLLTTSYCSPSSIIIVDKHEHRLSYLRDAYHIVVTTDAVDAVARAAIVVVAVKPQDASLVCLSLRKHIPKTALVISIMAGVPIRKLQEWFLHKRVIRAMPNTPVQIQCGMTVWMSTRSVTAGQKKIVRGIFSVFGEQFEVPHEDLIDAATAVSGSGPAYVFAFAEEFIHGARKVGFTPEQAQRLVMQTVFGAAQLMKQSGEDPSLLRQRVTSKKGTTAAALEVMGKKKMTAILDHMVRAAYDRAKELSRLY